jgi:site-specific DNA recombinase
MILIKMLSYVKRCLGTNEGEAIRVSTEDQAREGVSLVAQQAKIEAYATVKDWLLREVLRDEVTAKHLKRPGLERLLALVDAGQVDVVIVYKLDRLTRSVADLDKLMKLFERRHVALVSLQESLDATTATGRLTMNLLASVSQWEREVIGECTRDAMQHLKAQGRVYCRPVFADAATFAWMQTERAAGRSYERIAELLNAAGTATTRGGRWQGNTIRRILVRAAPRQERRVA